MLPVPDELPPSPPTPQFVRLRWMLTLFCWAVAIALVLYFFQAVALLFEGLLAACCLAAAMRPIADRLPGPRALRGIIAGIIPILIAAGLIALGAWMTSGAMGSGKLQFSDLSTRLDNVLARLGYYLGLGGALRADLAPHGWLNALIANSTAYFGHLAHALGYLGVWLAFVFIGDIFLLIEPPGTFTRPILSFLPLLRQRQLRRTFDQLEENLRHWVQCTVIICLIVGGLSGVLYWIVGIPLAAPLAIIAGLAEIMPDVGPILMWIPAALLAATVGFSAVIWVTLGYVGIHIVEAYILAPYIFRRAVRLPPLVTLFTIILWGEVLGLPGLFLAIPLDLTIWAFATNLLSRSPEYIHDHGQPAPEPEPPPPGARAMRHNGHFSAVEPTPSSALAEGEARGEIPGANAREGAGPTVADSSRPSAGSGRPDAQG